MSRDDQHRLDTSDEPLVQYLAGTLDMASSARLREMYGWTQDGVSVLDTVLDTVREVSPGAARVSEETLMWRLHEARERAGIAQMPAETRQSGFAEMNGGKAGTRSRLARGQKSGWGPGQFLRGHSIPVALSVAATLMATIWFGTHPQRRAMSSAKPVTYTTAAGQRANIVLPDGSTVLLNVASRLEVPADYMQGNRTLRLNGEALFTTTHRSDAPLSVVAGSVMTRVLGTRFVVRRYPEDTMTTVAVREGKVAVRSAVLVAAQEISVPSQGVAVPRPAEASRFGFVTGTLMLDHVSLGQAILEFNRWYDADIQLGDPRLAERGISGSWGAGSLLDLAETLELAFNVRCVQRGRVLILYPR